MEIKPIRDDKDHAAALAEIARLMKKRDLDSAGEDRLEVLSTLAEAYEKEHHALGSPGDPVRVLKTHMEMAGKSQTDLAELLGSRSRASEILGLQTPLSLSMIRKLTDQWGLPAEFLIAESPRKYARKRTPQGVQRLAKRVKK